MSNLKSAVNIPQDILDFYRDLNEVHSRFNDEMKTGVDAKRQKETLDLGAPILNLTGLTPDYDKLEQAVKEVCDVIRRHRPQLAGELSRIESEISTEEFAALAEKYLWQDNKYIAGFAAEKKLKLELFSLVLFNVVKPFATGCAKGLKGEFSTDSWGQSCCPVCGSKPAIAAIKGGNGERVLRCSMCETEWQFKNLKCPYCLNEDHETLGYFAIEDDDVYRVNSCGKCSGYIKTVNQKELALMENAFLTDIKTLHLDVLAEREGYTRDICAADKALN